MLPRAEIAHWLFAGGFLFFGLVLLAEAIVGPAVFRRRAWRACLWPSLALIAGALAVGDRDLLDLLDAPPARALGLGAGGDGRRRGRNSRVVRGRLHSSYWSLVTAGALLVSGASFLVHEQNGWLFARSAFLHHLIGWTLVVASVFPIGAALPAAPRRVGVRVRARPGSRSR